MGTWGSALSPGPGEGGTAPGVSTWCGGTGGVPGLRGLFPVGMGGCGRGGEWGWTLCHCPRVPCPGGHCCDHWGHRCDHRGHHQGQCHNAPAPCRGHPWVASVSQPVAEGTGKGSREPQQLLREVWGVPNPTAVLSPGAGGMWGQTAPSVPATSGSEPHSCPEHLGCPVGTTSSCGDNPSCGVTPSCGVAVPGQAGVPVPLSAVPQPRCRSWLLHPEPVPNFVSFPCFREPPQRRKWWKILKIAAPARGSPGATGILPWKGPPESGTSCCVPWVTTARSLPGAGGHLGGLRPPTLLAGTPAGGWHLGDKGGCWSPPASPEGGFWPP